MAQNNTTVKFEALVSLDHMPIVIAQDRYRFPGHPGDLREEHLICLGCVCGWYMYENGLVAFALEQYRRHHLPLSLRGRDQTPQHFPPEPLPTKE